LGVEGTRERVKEGRFWDRRMASFEEIAACSGALTLDRELVVDAKGKDVTIPYGARTKGGLWLAWRPKNALQLRGVHALILCLRDPLMATCQKGNVEPVTKLLDAVKGLDSPAFISENISTVNAKGNGIISVELAVRCLRAWGVADVFIVQLLDKLDHPGSREFSAS
jgi:hypothetical protein